MYKQIRSRMVARVAASLIVAALSASRLDAQNIEPTSPPIGAFTAVGTGWYLDVGQSFIAGGAYMNSFSFWFGPGFSRTYTGAGDPASGAVLVPYVMAWDGNQAVGSALFQGAAVLVSGLTSYTRYDFSTGDLAIDPGQMYIAFVQAVNDPAHTGNVRVGFSGFGGTGAAADNLQGQPVKSVNDIWDVTETGSSTTFAATFSNTVTATPEPATILLVATGMLGVLGRKRLRRRQA